MVKREKDKECAVEINGVCSRCMIPNTRSGAAPKGGITRVIGSEKAGCVYG